MLAHVLTFLRCPDHPPKRRRFAHVEHDEALRGQHLDGVAAQLSCAVEQKRRSGLPQHAVIEQNDERVPCAGTISERLDEKRKGVLVVPVLPSHRLHRAVAAIAKCRVQVGENACLLRGQIVGDQLGGHRRGVLHANRTRPFVAIAYDELNPSTVPRSTSSPHVRSRGVGNSEARSPVHHQGLTVVRPAEDTPLRRDAERRDAARADVHFDPLRRCGGAAGVGFRIRIVEWRQRVHDH